MTTKEINKKVMALMQIIILAQSVVKLSRKYSILSSISTNTTGRVRSKFEFQVENLHLSTNLTTDLNRIIYFFSNHLPKLVTFFENHRNQKLSTNEHENFTLV